ncbi:MAG TPA: RhuM family protein [Planctomycetota bacterium]|nr:RhuM family protein [Planctomycetota bacterium]
MSNPGGELILWQSDDKRTRINVRLEGETVWLNQRQLAELFQKDVRTINEHIQNIFDEGELQREATIRNFRIVQKEGDREVSRDIEFYNLDVIISVGYRVRSPRGTQFRVWATQRLKEYMIKGFVMDDERLKEGRGPDYFDELLERIRDIHASERRFYQKITDIYATSVDYDKNAQITKDFFATVQNKLHWAIHGHTAAE